MKFFRILAALWLFGYARAGETIFLRTDLNGEKGLVTSREFQRAYQKTLFRSAKWRIRILQNIEESDQDVALEIYSRPHDRRLWIACRRASPSVTGVAFRNSIGFEIKDGPNSIREVNVVAKEVALPSGLAVKIQKLGQVLLPGGSPTPPVKVRGSRPPLVLFLTPASAGTLKPDAIDSQEGLAFLDIVKGFVHFCESEIGFSDSDVNSLGEQIDKLCRLYEKK